MIDYSQYQRKTFIICMVEWHVRVVKKTSKKKMSIHPGLVVHKLCDFDQVIQLKPQFLHWKHVEAEQDGFRISF